MSWHVLKIALMYCICTYDQYTLFDSEVLCLPTQCFVYEPDNALAALQYTSPLSQIL